MKKKFLAMLMASVMVLGLAACGGSSDAATEGDAASGDLPTVGVLIYKYDDTYISTVRNSLQAALEGKANVEMQDGKGDQATQNDQLDVMISKGVDVLCVNMVDAKADWLYELPQWNAIFDEEKKKQLYREQKQSGTIRKGKKIGRNDPCPCGSGKKYKMCCGRNA